MDNTLQVRLSADITALVSALTKAKATIKSFESETAKESERGNIGFKRKIGLIEQLTNKAKALRVSLSQATNEKQVEQYNQALEETSKELTRLNSLGRSVTANLGSVGGGFGQVAKQGANASGVAIEFNRVIQDAPFGLIGIGNNLQQLAGNFANVTAEAKRTGGTVGTALKASFASLVSPVNLGLLAISALTAGFTAYQMGAFDFIFANEESKDSLENVKTSAEIYKESLDTLISSLSSVNSARLQGNESASKEIATIDLLRGVIEDESNTRETRINAIDRLQKLYPAIFRGIDKERVLIEGLSKEYGILTAAIFERATAVAIEEEAGKIGAERVKLLQKENSETNFQNDLLAKRNKLLADLENVKGLEVTAVASERLNKELAVVNGELETLGIIATSTTNELSKNQSSTDSLKAAYSGLNQELIGLVSNSEESVGSLKELSDIDFTLDKINLANSEELKKKLQEDIKLLFSDLLKEQNGTEVIDIPLDINFVPQEVNQELGIIEKLQAQIQSINALRDVATDPTRLQAYNAQLKSLQDQLSEFTTIQDPLVEKNKVLLDSFSALGIGIAASLDIGNKAFKGFVTTVLSAAPKIIQALIAQSAAKRAAASKDVATNAQVAASEGIAVGAKAANALGPVGLALLPVFIGGALALISGAFSKIGGGGNISGGGGGSMPSGSSSSGKAPQLFTNAFAPSIPASSSPTPSGSIDFDRAQGRLSATVTGEDISFVYDRYQERKKGGG